jgi:hypothetical protein
LEDPFLTIKTVTNICELIIEPMKYISWITSASVESGAEVYLMLEIIEVLISSPTISEYTWKLIELRRSLKVAKDGIGRHLYKMLCHSLSIALRRDKR